MARDSKDAPRSRRFSSQNSAENFAKAVKGTVNDLRGNENYKSNFKVNYTKGDAQNRTDLD